MLKEKEDSWMFLPSKIFSHGSIEWPFNKFDLFEHNDNQISIVFSCKFYLLQNFVCIQNKRYFENLIKWNMHTIIDQISTWNDCVSIYFLCQSVLDTFFDTIY